LQQAPVPAKVLPTGAREESHRYPFAERGARPASDDLSTEGGPFEDIDTSESLGHRVDHEARGGGPGASNRNLDSEPIQVLVE